MFDLTKKQNQNFAWVCITMVIRVKKIYKFKTNNSIVNFPAPFCLGRISKRFDYVEVREMSLKGVLYDLSVDYDAIDKSNILKIHKYLMVKNNSK